MSESGVAPGERHTVNGVPCTAVTRWTTPDVEEPRYVEVEWRHVQHPCTVRLWSGRNAGVWWIIDTAIDPQTGWKIVTRQRAHPRNTNGQIETGIPPQGTVVRVLQPDDPEYLPAPTLMAAEKLTAGLSDDGRDQFHLAFAKIVLGAVTMATRPLSDTDDPARPAPYDCPLAEAMSNRHLAAHLVGFHTMREGDIPDLASPPDRNVLIALHASQCASTVHDHVRMDQ